MMSGCGGSSSTGLSSSDRDRINAQVDEMNSAWKKFRAAANACMPSDPLACLTDALTSSGLESAVTGMHDVLVSVEANTTDEHCKSGLGLEEDGLTRLSTALARFRNDVAEGDIRGIRTSASGLVIAWESAIQSEKESQNAC